MYGTMVSENNNPHDAWANGSAEPHSKKPRKRTQVSAACSTCKKAHTACSNKRPCERCIRINQADQCSQEEVPFSSSKKPYTEDVHIHNSNLNLNREVSYAAVNYTDLVNFEPFGQANFNDVESLLFADIPAIDPISSFVPPQTQYDLSYPRAQVVSANHVSPPSTLAGLADQNRKMEQVLIALSAKVETLELAMHSQNRSLKMVTTDNAKNSALPIMSTWSLDDFSLLEHNQRFAEVLEYKELPSPIFLRDVAVCPENLTALEGCMKNFFTGPPGSQVVPKRFEKIIGLMKSNGEVARAKVTCNTFVDTPRPVMVMMAFLVPASEIVEQPHNAH